MIFDPGLFLLNIQGASSQKFNDLFLDISDYNISFICLTETWFNKSSIDSFHVDGYSLDSYFCRTGTTCGGVAIYTRDGLNVKDLKLNKFCIEKDIEICGISCRADGRLTIVVCCYRSPTGKLQVFFEKISAV